MILRIPDAIFNQQNNNDNMPMALKAMIAEVYGDDLSDLPEDFVTSRAILCTKVSLMMMVNEYLTEKVQDKNPIMPYRSADEAMGEDRYIVTMDQLHESQPSGSPPHHLRLKVGSVVMLLRNLDPLKGLSNGTRMIVTAIFSESVVCRIISESHRGDTVFIPKMNFELSIDNLPVTLKRFQLPLIPSFAMTVNKSQGQTFEKLGLYLPDACFSHGQLYVALSRCREQKNIKIHVSYVPYRQGRLHKTDHHIITTQNVVYHEVFQHGELDRNLPDLEAIDPELAAAVNRMIAEDLAEIENPQVNIFHDQMEADRIREEQEFVARMREDYMLFVQDGVMDLAQLEEEVAKELESHRAYVIRRAEQDARNLRDIAWSDFESEDEEDFILGHNPEDDPPQEDVPPMVDQLEPEDDAVVVVSGDDDGYDADSDEPERELAIFTYPRFSLGGVKVPGTDMHDLDLDAQLPHTQY